MAFTRMQLPARGRVRKQRSSPSRGATCGAGAEAERTSNELAAIGVRNQRLILNGFVLPPIPDPVALALERRGAESLSAANDFLAKLPLSRVPLRSYNLVGIPALRALVSSETLRQSEPRNGGTNISVPATESLNELVDAIAESGRGVVMTMGKGGVGKTTIAAAAIATNSPGAGFKVHLSTTDPAAHVAAAAGQLAGLQVSRIDPQMETRAYK